MLNPEVLTVVNRQSFAQLTNDGSRDLTVKESNVPDFIRQVRPKCDHCAAFTVSCGGLTVLEATEP